MATLLKKMWKGYVFVFDELADPRTKTWFLTAKPYQVTFIIGIYLMFILKWGPNWMKKRPAFNLDKVLIVYNAFQVLACLYLFISSIWYPWGWDYKWICEPIDYSYNEKSMKVASLVHIYFMLKVIDLLDTVFFVLRKKYNQMSFLHIYHHAGMVFFIWGATTYIPGGHGTFLGVLNSFVHIVMYSYYLLTVVAKPSMRNALWFKKSITQLQILQFSWLVFHNAMLVVRVDCAYPRWMASILLPQSLFMLILFMDFYRKSYTRTPKKNLA